jgi:uncharacterized protein (TIGR03083 family)
VEVAQHIEAVGQEGVHLADAAARAGCDAAVPSCPGWTVRDLLRHQGMVHRWAAANLRRNRSDPPGSDENEALPDVEDWPLDDAGLLGWFRDGHAALVDTLSSVPDDLVAFTFLPAPTPRAFWARRQAHETAMHRADAELATGAVTAYGAAFAADGIDEFVRGFAARKGKYAFDPARTMLLAPTDDATRWLLRIGPERLTVDAASSSPPDCTVAGTASDLYLWIWNRSGPESITVTGAADLAGLWRSTSGVRWG